mmetsp:Transcript_74640/g.216581  ORF Transcript_74640/g.216581 Transcript_74640/m.216581 type:complete len:227 (+) Transcript_74640:614-1294(+)
MPMSSTWFTEISPVKAPSPVLLTFSMPMLMALPSTSFIECAMCNAGAKRTMSALEASGPQPLNAAKRSFVWATVFMDFQLPPTMGFLCIPLFKLPVVRKPGPAKVHLPTAESSSSMRRSWLYFARRSERHGAPVLISPVRRPTTRSAMKESSVSPDLCDTMTPQPACCDICAASIASVIEPIWLTFKRSALHAFTSRALAIRFGFVTNKSSPTICTLSPTAAWNLV